MRRPEGSSGFQCVQWKVLTPANISWCFLSVWMADAASALAPIVTAFHLNVNTIITAGDATAGISPPVRLLRVSVRLCQPLPLSSVLFNSYHYAPTEWNPFETSFSSSLAPLVLFKPWHSRSFSLWLRKPPPSRSLPFTAESSSQFLTFGSLLVKINGCWKVTVHVITAKHCSLQFWRLRSEI